MILRRFSGTAAAWIVLLAYASLYPFAPLRLPASDAVAAAFGTVRYVTAFDVWLNVLAYAPLGMLLTRYFLKTNSRSEIAISKAILFGAGFSFGMETAQLFIPGRVSSIYDTMANTFGTALGALAFAEPLRSLVTHPLGERREALVIAGNWGDAGLAVVVMWLLAQLNPALPFFGAGQHPVQRHRYRRSHDPPVGCCCDGHLGLRTFRLGAARARPGRASRDTRTLVPSRCGSSSPARRSCCNRVSPKSWRAPAASWDSSWACCFSCRRAALDEGHERISRLVLILAGALFSKIVGAYSPLDEFCVFSAGPMDSWRTSLRSRGSSTNSGPSSRSHTSSRSSCAPGAR